MPFDEPLAASRLAGLARLSEELSRSRSPSETLRAIRRGLADVYGPVASIMLSTQALADDEYRVLQVRLDDAGAEPETDPWSAGRPPVRRGGVIGRIIRSREPRLVQDVDWSQDAEFRDTLGAYRSVIAVPFSAEHLPMNWIMLLDRPPQVFSEDDLEQTVLRAALVGSLLESQSLAGEVAKAHALIDAEVRRVGQIQRELLPNPLPDIPGLRIGTSYETFGQAGGDLYDFIPLGGPYAAAQPWAIFIGDASGHGPSAAVVIAIVQALLHSCPASDARGGPAALLGYVNDQLCRKPILGSFVTAFVAVYDPASPWLLYASAGHPPPLLIRSAGRTVEYLDRASTLPLGIEKGHSFRQAQIGFDAGDTLLLYTDGIDESRNPADDMFGIGGIEAAARRCTGGPDDLVAAVRDAVARHAAGRPATDDQTLVAVRRGG